MSTPEVRDECFSETHWRSLRYFNLYRLAVATLLFFSALFHPSAFPVFGLQQGLQQLLIAGAYLIGTGVGAAVAYRHRQHASMQLTASVMVDVLVMTMLIHVGGGLGSGLGSMLLVTLAGAGLVGEGRLVLFYAAMATLAVLLEQTYRAIHNDFDAAGFFHAGVFSAGCFAVAILARLLARRVIANEALATQRGVDLKNQMVISQRVLEEMQDGVLVLGRDGRVRQSNPRARQLLGLNGGRDVGECSPELAQGFRNWCRDSREETTLVRVPVTGLQLRARFVPTASTGDDVLVFMEDIGRLQEQAQQIKLAALGRLTANIAHEIRNPLSAISHASELLREERRGPLYERLLRIVLDNALRLDRIVQDVLELGRRDRSCREVLDLREILPTLIEEYLGKQDLPEEVIQLECSGVATLCFDRSHFHQVLWNLLGNALRHSRQVAGSVRVLVRDVPAESRVEVHVIDDGEGVDEACREQIFEPFFTTHQHGTGLGLYIARELCDANGAQLELQPAGPGADFRLMGGAVGC